MTDERWDTIADWFLICMAGFFFGGALSAIVLACCGCSSPSAPPSAPDASTPTHVYGDAGLILAPSPPNTMPAADTSEPTPAASGGALRKFHP